MECRKYSRECGGSDRSGDKGSRSSRSYESVLIQDGSSRAYCGSIIQDRSNRTYCSESSGEGEGEESSRHREVYGEGRSAGYGNRSRGIHSRSYRRIKSFASGTRVQKRGRFSSGRGKRIVPLLTTVIFLLAVSGFFGADLISAKAGDRQHPGFHKYYTSIQIKEGDSLWSIAKQYKTNSGKTTGEFVDELKRMNRLNEDTIHAGNYLTVSYYQED